MIIHRLFCKSDINCVRLSADSKGLWYQTTKDSEYKLIPLREINYIE